MYFKIHRKFGIQILSKSGMLLRNRKNNHIMEQTESYIKEQVLKDLDAGMPHPSLRVLFADNGIVPTNKGKTRQCIIIINLAGIYFIRPKGLLRSTEIIDFISVYDLVEIKYVDPKKREIISNSNTTYFTCEHSDSAVHKLLACRAQLFYKAPDLHPVKLTGFPQTPTVSQTRVDFGEEISVLRYICLSVQAGDPISPSIIELFKRIGTRSDQTITFDESIDGARSLKALSIPLTLLNNISTVHFKKIIPYSVCRLAHYLLKKSSSIRTIIFENYTVFIPYQLKLRVLKHLKFPVSLIFSNCIISDHSFMDLTDELATFPGEFQRLSFNRVNVSANAFTTFFTSIKKSRAFRTLEFFEFDHVDPRNLPQDKINAGIESVLKHCRFLNHISISNWAEQMEINLQMFINHSTLSEIVLQMQEMSQPFPADMKLPAQIHLLDFSNSNFTFTSLQSLFILLSQYKSPLSLNLSDISLPDIHWKNLFDQISNLAPVSCIRELDWSGNKIAYQSMKQFVDYFIVNNPIKYFAIDRIFIPATIEDLKYLLSFIPKGKLWGLSVGGDVERNFHGKFPDFLTVLQTIMPLKCLSIDGQNMSDIDSDHFVDFIKQNNSIVEVSCDETLLNNETRFYDFYNELLQAGVSIVERPNKDIAKLFGKCLPALSMKPKWPEFVNIIQTKRNAPSRSARSSYLCRVNTGDDFDFQSYIDFLDVYPRTYFDMNMTDAYGINFSPTIPSMISIFQVNESESHSKIAPVQAKLLRKPITPPDFGTSVIPSGQSIDFNSFKNPSDHEPMKRSSSFSEQKPPISGPVPDSNMNVVRKSTAPTLVQPLQTSQQTAPDPFTTSSSCELIGVNIPLESLESIQQTVPQQHLNSGQTSPAQQVALQPLSPVQQPLQQSQQQLSPLAPQQTSPPRPIGKQTLESATEVHSLKPIDSLLQSIDMTPLEPLEPIQQETIPLQQLQPPRTQPAQELNPLGPQSQPLVPLQSEPSQPQSLTPLQPQPQPQFQPLQTAGILQPGSIMQPGSILQSGSILPPVLQPLKPLESSAPVFSLHPLPSQPLQPQPPQPQPQTTVPVQQQPQLTTPPLPQQNQQPRQPQKPTLQQVQSTQQWLQKRYQQLQQMQAQQRSVMQQIQQLQQQQPQQIQQIQMLQQRLQQMQAQMQPLQRQYLQQQQAFQQMKAAAGFGQGNAALRKSQGPIMGRPAQPLLQPPYGQGPNMQ
ncbi:hypothetical protein TRFO_23183 [Tritrichomonas foetus]|uniref:Uncharacterized protein n=1 Tax=Tritrichomonas foetus TaxID=1144522 RepID=A0A1J4KBK4_9EUKA|nr:hypothetical protein TRFO_23183 [Tritrichomonas foetus]|eukprot:OHT08354.1 hypothetical protein TRFO_23183 [Tritrichomonas foetus]